MSINCSLIIDSCCDLPRDVVDAEGVKVVGFSYNNESGSHIDDMYASLTAHDFYEAMRGGDEPSTSQVTLGEFLEVFKQAYEEGKPAVLLSFSSALSGSYSTACIAADQIKQEHPDFELHVVDTKLASIAEGLDLRSDQAAPKRHDRSRACRLGIRGALLCARVLHGERS